MKTLIQLSLLGLLASGCVVVPGYRHYGPHGTMSARSTCPPSYHWDGYACVHNGHGHGNGRR